MASLALVEDALSLFGNLSGPDIGRSDDTHNAAAPERSRPGSKIRSDLVSAAAFGIVSIRAELCARDSLAPS